MTRRFPRFPESLSRPIPWNSMKSSSQPSQHTCKHSNKHVPFAWMLETEREWWELGPTLARGLPETFSRDTEPSLLVCHATRYDDAIAMYNKVGLSCEFAWLVSFMAIGCQLDADSDRYLISSHWATLNVFMYLPKEIELQVRRRVTELYGDG